MTTALFAVLAMRFVTPTSTTQGGSTTCTMPPFPAPLIVWMSSMGIGAAAAAALGEPLDPQRALSDVDKRKRAPTTPSTTPSTPDSTVPAAPAKLAMRY